MKIYEVTVTNDASVAPAEVQVTARGRRQAARAAITVAYGPLATGYATITTAAGNVRYRVTQRSIRRVPEE